MLETVHEYAREVDATAERDAVYEAHASWALALAAKTHTRKHLDDETASQQLERDHDNLRAALAWLRERDPQRQLRLAGALGWFWQSRGHLREGRLRLQAAVERALRDDVDLARALVHLGAMTSLQEDSDATLDWLRRGVALWRAAGDRSETASALESLAYALVQAIRRRL